jgi:hypothetical protein
MDFDEYSRPEDTGVGPLEAGYEFGLVVPSKPQRLGLT